MTLSRSGRVLVYTNQVPYETDILRTNMYRMCDIATLAQAVLGFGINNATLVSDLACTPTSPPGMTVNVAPGSIYQYVEYDPEAYGVIPADTSDMLYKQGVNLEVTNLACPAPSVPATTNYYLIEAQLDTNYSVNSVTRPYYNSAAPQSPIFNTAPDTVTDTVALQTKVSTSGIPTPDSGWVGLWSVTVAYGATTITSGDIAVYSDAPFITETLTQKISSAGGDARYVQKTALQAGSYVYGADSSVSANTITVSLTPTLTTYTVGGRYYIKIANTNTGPTTINIDSLGSNVVAKTGSAGIVALSGYELVAGFTYEFLYQSSQFQLIGQVTPNIFASLNMSTGQNVANDAAYHVLGFDTIVLDPYSITTAGSYIITAPVTGYYRINAAANVTNGSNVSGANTTGSFSLGLYKNGSFLFKLDQSAWGDDNNGLSGTRIIHLDATDYLQLFGLNSGNNSAVTVSNASSDKTSAIFELEFIGS